MKLETRAGQRKAKTRFFILYAVSLVLVFVVMSAFWKALGTKRTDDSHAPSHEGEAYFMALDTMLYARLERYDAASKRYLQARQAGNADADATPLYSARNAFANALDSVERQAALLTEGPKKTTMGLVSARFKSELANREILLNSVVQLPTISTKPVDDTVNNEAAALKQQLQEKDNLIVSLQSQLQAGVAAKSSATSSADAQNALAEKDKLIASLQTQLKQKEAALQSAGAPQKNTASGGEWQQKYLSLKASFDKVSASEKSLRSAYQSLADDNRRLLSQVQSARKG